MNRILIILLIMSLHTFGTLTSSTTRQESLLYNTDVIPVIRTNVQRISETSSIFNRSNIFTTITKTTETSKLVSSNVSTTTNKNFALHSSSVPTAASSETDQLCFSNTGAATTSDQGNELSRLNASTISPGSHHSTLSMTTMGSSQLHSGTQAIEASLYSTIDQSSIHRASTPQTMIGERSTEKRSIRHTSVESTSKEALILPTNIPTTTGEEGSVYRASIPSATGGERRSIHHPSTDTTTGERSIYYSSIPTMTGKESILHTNMSTSTVEENPTHHSGTPSTITKTQSSLFHSAASTTCAYGRTTFHHRRLPTTVDEGVFRSNISREYGVLQYEDVQLICASARTYPTLEDKMDKLMVRVKSGERLATNIYIDNTPSHKYRAYSVIIKSVVEQIQYANTNNLPVWYVFDGIGSEWVGMADDLMKVPVGAQTLRKLHEALKTEGYDLLGTILSQNASVYDSVINTFTCITAVQIALIDLLLSINLYPCGIIGYSVGEISCAYADGALTAEEAILTAYFRGRSIVEANVPSGSMALIGLPLERLQRRLLSNKNISVACHNSPDSVTISGLSRHVNAFVSLLKADKVHAREFRCHEVAFHSECIKEAGPIYSQYLQKVIKSPKQRTERWISSSAEKSRWNTPMVKFAGPDYFVNNLLSPVLFHEAAIYLPRRSVILEIGPHNILQTTLKRILAKKTIILSLQRKVNARNLAYMMTSIGRFYISGGRFQVPEGEKS